MKKVIILVVGLVVLYLAVMRPWECVNARANGGGSGVGMNGDWATWVDCSY